MFIKKLQENMSVVETDNGALVYNTSTDNLLDLFSTIGAMRNRDFYSKSETFKKAFYEDKLLALKILFYSRDIRGGLGERQTFKDLYFWIIKNFEEIAIKNIENFPKFGRWDDLIELAYITKNSSFSKTSLRYISKQLELDLQELEKGNEISLLGKWMPSNNTSSQKSKNIAFWLEKELKISKSNYRKLLSKLRKYLDIVETKLSQGGDIDYEKIPSRAMSLYRNAFSKRNPKEWDSYIESLKKGEAKVNASTLYPYDIINKFLYERGSLDNLEVLEEQWKALPNYIKEPNYRGLVVADVSGSMHGLPMCVAISLAMYISEKCQGEFHNKFMTFSEKPTLQIIPEASLSEKIKFISNSDWGMNTNLSKVFEIILKTAVNSNLKQEELPKDLIVITDMEFDSAMDSRSETKLLFETLKKKYSEKNYVLPRVVFWNVNAMNNRFPMRSDENCVYVSGCSPTVMKSVVNGEILDSISLMLNEINNERYDSVVI